MWGIDTVRHAMPDASSGDLVPRAVLSRDCWSLIKPHSASPADGQARVLAAAEKTSASADERGLVLCVARARCTFEKSIAARRVDANRRSWFE